MMNVNPLFSVIIPHKNTPDLLQRCLDSIPRRDDVQIIVVDDNSDPKLVDFEKFPGLNDNNIEVYFTKEGKGAGYARNVGMSHAKGEWLIFADADDYFYTDNLSKLMDMDIPDEYDVVVWKSKYVYLDGTFFWLGDDEIVESFNGNLVKCSMPENIYLKYTTPWSKLVRKKIVLDNHITFEEIRFANDEMFATKLGLSVNSYAFANIDIYCHERHIGSLMENTTLENCFCRLNVLLRKNKLMRYYGKNMMDLTVIYRRIYFISYIAFLISYVREIRLLGIKQAYYDYKNTCESLKIYKLPFLYKISPIRFVNYIKRNKTSN